MPFIRWWIFDEHYLSMENRISLRKLKIHLNLGQDKYKSISLKFFQRIFFQLFIRKKKHKLWHFQCLLMKFICLIVNSKKNLFQIAWTNDFIRIQLILCFALGFFHVKHYPDSFDSNCRQNIKFTYCEQNASSFIL